MSESVMEKEPAVKVDVPGFGNIASMGPDGVVNENGAALLYADASQLQLRAIAKARRIGSGVWRAGARKAQFIEAFGAISRGEAFDFEVAIPEPHLVKPDVLPDRPDGHKDLAALMAVLNAKVPAFLVGPAGTGKSSAVFKFAKMKQLPFYAKSVSVQTSESGLMGYNDGYGKPVRSLLREAVEHGGVYLLDEADAGNANVLAVVNSVLANDEIGFPDAVVKKHPDFYFAATGNTWGAGANAQFVGRQQLDAATLDRFAFIWWGDDDALDFIACGLPVPGDVVVKPEYEFDPAAGSKCAVQRGVKWVKHCHAVRDAVARHSVRAIVSRRACQYGVRLLDAGLSWRSVERLVIQKGMADDVWRRVSADAA